MFRNGAGFRKRLELDSGDWERTQQSRIVFASLETSARRSKNLLRRGPSNHCRHMRNPPPFRRSEIMRFRAAWKSLVRCGGKSKGQWSGVSIHLLQSGNLPRGACSFHHSLSALQAAFCQCALSHFFTLRIKVGPMSRCEHGGEIVIGKCTPSPWTIICTTQSTVRRCGCHLSLDKCIYHTYNSR